MGSVVIRSWWQDGQNGINGKVPKQRGHSNFQGHPLRSRPCHPADELPVSFPLHASDFPLGNQCTSRFGIMASSGKSFNILPLAQRGTTHFVVYDQGSFNLFDSWLPLRYKNGRTRQSMGNGALFPLP